MEQVKQVEKKNLLTSSKYEGLAAAMAAELMIGFWFGIGAILAINPPGTKGFGTHTKHQGGGSKRTPPVSQEREMLQT